MINIILLIITYLLIKHLKKTLKGDDGQSQVSQFYKKYASPSNTKKEIPVTQKPKKTENTQSFSPFFLGKEDSEVISAQEVSKFKKMAANSNATPIKFARICINIYEQMLTEFSSGSESSIKKLNISTALQDKLIKDIKSNAKLGISEKIDIVRLHKVQIIKVDTAKNSNLVEIEVESEQVIIKLKESETISKDSFIAKEILVFKSDKPKGWELNDIK